MRRKCDGVLPGRQPPQHEIKHLCSKRRKRRIAFVAAAVTATVAIHTVAVVACFLQIVHDAVTTPGNGAVGAACGIRHITIPLPLIALLSHFGQPVAAE